MVEHTMLGRPVPLELARFRARMQAGFLGQSRRMSPQCR